MPLTRQEHAPQVRCYNCGSPEIFSLCHHCGRGMCHRHSTKAVDAANKPVSKEFAGLGLEDKQAGAYHCAEHDHVVRGNLLVLIMAGAIVAVVGVLVAFASVLLGLLLLLAGAACAGLAYRARQGRKAAELAARPPLPLISNLDSVSVLETLRGQVRLGEDGAYTSTPQPTAGQLEVVMTLAKADRDRLNSYRSKYGLTGSDPVKFSAGYGALEGEAGLAFQPGPGQEAMLLPGGAGISFQGEVSGHPLFSTERGRPAGQWTVRLPYGLHDARAPESIPIWFVPSLVPASDKRTLELDLHWVALGEDRPGQERKPLDFDRFELIELVVPKSWGNVESVSPTAFISNPESEQVRTIQWRQLTRTEAGSQTLTIRFEKRIDTDDKLTGNLRASFQGTLSGVTDVGMYRPTGGHWLKPPESSIRLEASVGFELSLRSIRYQDVRVVPDRSKDHDRPEVDEFSEVIPDYLTVIELTNMLSDSGYYVKRVIENPPRGGGRANLVNRYWDIAGRHYDGVFPIDFHITLTGEEEYRGSIRANAGNTSARLQVHGSYVNQAMETQIKHEWDTLHKKVGAKLDERKTFAPAQETNLPPPMGPPPPPNRAADGHDPARAATLRARREAAIDSLVAGRISEETFRRIEADIQAELGDS
jgi:hypothetical protein